MKKKFRESASDLLGDVLRRVPLSGVSELKLPSDLRRVLVANIENMREGAIDAFAKEISKVLSKIDFQTIIDDVIKNYSLKVEAKIELQPKGPRKRAKKIEQK